MKKLLTSSITSSAAFPVKAGTLDFLQLAYQEAITALANAAIGRSGDVTNGYLLHGLVNSGSTGSMNVSAGAIYYAGEIFLVDAFTLTVSDTAVASIAQTFYGTNADPVTFTDGSTHNVHQIRKIVFTNGASGSGLFDFNAMVPVPPSLTRTNYATLSGTLTLKFTSDQTIFASATSGNLTITFDLTNALAGTVVRLKFAFGAGQTVTVTAPSGCTAIKDSGNMASAASNTNVMYFLYAGKNSGGNDEVSYTIKQV